MRKTLAFGLGLIACRPTPVEPRVAGSVDVGPGDLEPRGARDAQRAQYVVVTGGTPLFERPGDTNPRGWLGSSEHIGGWAMHRLATEGDFVAVSAELAPSHEHCARTVEGLSGLDTTLWVRANTLARVIVREVELRGEDCESLVVRPGVVVTALCQDDGVPRYRIGSCPNAWCVYEIPNNALGNAYVPGPSPATNEGADLGTQVPMPCVDETDASGRRKPHVAQTPGGGLSLTSPDHDHDAEQLPPCHGIDGAKRCAIVPRLGVDHVRYEVAEGTAITWRDGTPAGVAERPHRFRPVPHELEERLCWAAVEGRTPEEDLQLCAPASALRRVEEAHAVVLQAKRDGRRDFPRFYRGATRCYRRALDTAPDLSGRVRAKYRVADGKATLLLMNPRRSDGEEAFARCLAAEVERDREDLYELEITVDLHGPVTHGAGG
jgi:hypothetical protein